MLPSIPRFMRLTGKVPPSWQAIEAVMTILRESPNGVTTREMYQRATPKTIPRNATESSVEHPFTSMRYLKKTVLESLKEKGVIEKVHVRRDPNTTPESEAAVAPAPAGSKSKKKKQASNVPKLTWYWRIHEWERNVEEAKAKQERKAKAVEEAAQASSTSTKEEATA